MTNEFPVLDGDQQIGHRHAEPYRSGGAGGGSDAPVDLHRRGVLARAGHHFAVCSCGWVSSGFYTEHGAWETVCEVEAILADSGERKRRLLQGVA